MMKISTTIKKFSLVFIALFVMGDMCHGQSLTTGQNLTRQQLLATRQPIQKAKSDSQVSRAMAAEDATAFMVVEPAYDAIGKFTPGGAGIYAGYPFRMEMPAGDASGDVTITGFYDFSKYADVTTETITGKYDADARTVTIATPFNQKSANKCLKIGTYKRGDYQFTGVLAACKIADEPDMSGDYPINIYDELVFDVAADGTLTPRTSWLIYSFGDIQNGIENIFVQTTVKTVTEEANFMAVPAEANFPDNTVYAGTKASMPLYLMNYGRNSADCDYDINGRGLSLAAYKQVAGLTFNEYNLMLEAPSEGAYSGNITIKYAGKTLNIPVTANVLKKIDYNSIVKNGSFKFSLPTSEYTTYIPWIITDEITGSPVAYAKTADTMSPCGMDIEMEVPAGHTGVFSWKGICRTMSPAGFQVILDNNDLLYNNCYNWNGYYAEHNADGYVLVPEGKHTLTFEYSMTMDWESMGCTGPQSAYVWDLDLQTYEQKDNLGVMPDNTVDFGTWYLDKFINGATAEASILNLGKQPLRVTGGVDSENFSVTGIGTEVDNLQTLKALIAFHGNKLGDYDETVTVKTNGGDFLVRCVAKAEKIINDYQYLVKEGDLSFGTSVNHPFTADKTAGNAYSSTAKMESTVDDADSDSWLSVSFVIPEGKQGTLSWNAYNSFNDLLVFADVPSFSDGTQLFIDGEKIIEFAGICDASSSEIDMTDLIFRPGTHTVKFNYVRKSSKSEGNEDRVVISSVGLSMKDSGVDAIDGSKTLVSETWYTLDGRRISSPSAGLCIRQARYSDGTTSTTKVIRR